MMKSKVLNKILFLFVISLSFVGVCFAADEDDADQCLLEDRVNLKDLASKVKVTYEPLTLYCTYDDKKDINPANDVEKCSVTPSEDWTDDPNQKGDVVGYKKYALALKIYNLPKELLVTVTYKKEMKNYYSHDADEDGVVSVVIDDITEIRNLPVSISGSGSPCYLYTVKSFKMTLPKYNYYSGFSECEGIEDYYACQKYITFDMDGEYFQKHVESYREKLASMQDSSISLDDNNSAISKVTGALAEHKYLVVAAVLVVGAGVAFAIIKLKKVRK